MPGRFLRQTKCALRDIFRVTHGDVDATIRDIGDIAGKTLHVSLHRIEFRAQRAEPFVYVLRVVLFWASSHRRSPFVWVDQVEEEKRE
jgi:hypothetical protein